MTTQFVQPGSFVGLVGMTASISGMLAVCRECDAKMAGIEHEESVYPPGCRVPQGPHGGDVRVCGVCRKAFREDQAVQAIRLTEAECDGELPKPGVHMACPDCVASYQPRIIARLKATGVIPAWRGDDTLSEDWLL